MASRLAASGYSAIAVDLLSEEGGSAKVGEADAGAALNAADGTRFVADVKSTLDELAKREPGAKLGLIGFCFGGTTTWAVLGSGEPRLAAAAPFYGTVEPDVDFTGTTAAVLGVYGETDDRVNATRDTAKAALEKAGLTHELRTFPGTGHAFFNDTNAPPATTPPRPPPPTRPSSTGSAATWPDPRRRRRRRRRSGHSRKPSSNSPGQPRRSCSARRTAARSR